LTTVDWLGKHVSICQHSSARALYTYLKYAFRSLPCALCGGGILSHKFCQLDGQCAIHYQKNSDWGAYGIAAAIGQACAAALHSCTKLMLH
jgi:hypothetical protein